MQILRMIARIHHNRGYIPTPTESIILDEKGYRVGLEVFFVPLESYMTGSSLSESHIDQHLEV